MTKDNVGGGIKNDEAGILYRLAGVMSILPPIINSVIEGYHLKLPELATIDYDIQFDTQEGAFATGINVREKK